MMKRSAIGKHKHKIYSGVYLTNRFHVAMYVLVIGHR